MHWIFGSWYTKKEIGKRAALFAMCAYAGSMFSGFIQSGVQKGLNGMFGLKGWCALMRCASGVERLLTSFYL